MSSKSPGRQLQRLAEDELGMRPILGHCANIMAAAPRDPAHSREEHLARVFEANRDRLLASAKQKAARDE